ncbi:aldehyde dehydrogenase [Lichtheimia hyalospora FSU 10163]|nr:aldehyde dehydrogenase [Lichtheimia hyalospora FSU 10163]
MLEYTPVKDIPSIVQSLHEQFESGLTKDLAYRKQQLKNMCRFIEENIEELQKVIYDDLHKHKLEAAIGEILAVSDECKYMIKNLNRLSKPKQTRKRYMINAADKTFVRKEPKGVTLVIGAWNYPVRLLLMPVVGAIAAGNCVILKPSEIAENTATYIARRLPDYLDRRAYVVVNGAVPETTALLEQKLDHIFYTGNGNVGRIVMAAASKNLTPVTLELGGKSPVVITPSAELETSARRILWGKFFNCGQTCIAPDYVLLPEDKVDDFLKVARKVLDEFFGDNACESESYGRIINTRQFDRLKNLLDNITEGSKIVIGGQVNRDQLYIAPTLVCPVAPNDAVLMQEELFGPVLPIVPVKDVDEAIAVINSKDKPLSLYIFSNKRAESNQIMNKTNSGGILVNDTLMHLQETSLPFGGVGPSGMGAYHGDKSFETFTHERATMVRSTAMESMMKVRYPPYDDDKMQVMTVMVGGMPAAATAKIKTVANVCSSVWHIFFSRNKTSKL